MLVLLKIQNLFPNLLAKKRKSLVDPDCNMTNDQIAETEAFSARRTVVGFINDIYSSWDKLSQEKIQNAHYLQPEVMETN